MLCYKDVLLTRYGQTTTVTVSPYVPAIPTNADYSECLSDPNSNAEVELLGPNMLEIVARNGLAVEAGVDDISPGHLFSAPASGLPQHVYDLKLAGAVPLYLALFKSGVVGYVENSSDGQTYVSTPEGDEYITTVWSVDCDGIATAGISGGLKFQFFLNVNGEVVTDAALHAGLGKKRQAGGVTAFPNNNGINTIPRTPAPLPPGQKCPAGQGAFPKNPPVNPTANGCGAKGSISWYVIPNLDFEEACNAHDICFGTCEGTTFNGCNSDFLGRMQNACNRNTEAGSLKRRACMNAASSYHYMVSTERFGAKAFASAMREHCDCKCTTFGTTQCGDKCVNLQTDPTNCGSCGNACSVVEGARCVNGQCTKDIEQCVANLRCEAGYLWLKQGNGSYRCAGGGHTMSAQEASNKCLA